SVSMPVIDSTSALPTARSAISLHDALPISAADAGERARGAHREPRAGPCAHPAAGRRRGGARLRPRGPDRAAVHRALRAALLHRSEEHTSELQSREKLVCRLLLAKKKNSEL